MYLLHLLDHDHHGPFPFSGVVIAENVDEAGDEGLGDATMVRVQMLLEDFLNTSLRSAWFIDKAFFWYKENFQSCDMSLQLPDYQDF